MALKLIMWMSVRILMPMIGSKKKYDKRSPVYRSFGVEIAQNLSLNSFQGSKSSQIATLIFFTRQLSTTGQPTYQIPSFPTHISRLVLHSLPSQTSRYPYKGSSWDFSNWVWHKVGRTHLALQNAWVY